MPLGPRARCCHGQPGQNSAPEKDELTEWFKKASGAAPVSGEEPAAHEEAPASFASQPSGPEAEVPDTNTNQSAFGTDFGEPALSPEAEVPDWIKKLDANQSDSAKDTPQPAPTPEAEVPDWIKRLDANQPDSVQETAQPAAPGDVEIPDWIKSLDAAAPVLPDQPEKGKEPSSPLPEATDVPDWLKSLDQESAAEQPGVGSGSGEVLPSWLNTAGPAVQEPPASPTPEVPPPAQAAPPFEESISPGELPDWIAALKPIETQASEPVEPAVSAFKPEPSAAEPVAPFPAQDTPEPSAASTAPVSAFTELPASSEDVDAIFASMQMPDWLSEIAESKPASSDESLPPAANEEEPIEPAELPSWVQAMRPVEAAMRDTTAGPPDAQLEERGALAGLQGVLPAIPGAAAATSKPKSQSIKLEATDQQQAHAGLLEQILSAETAPVPMKAEFHPRVAARFALGPERPAYYCFGWCDFWEDTDLPAARPGAERNHFGCPGG